MSLELVFESFVSFASFVLKESLRPLLDMTCFLGRVFFTTKDAKDTKAR